MTSIIPRRLLVLGVLALLLFIIIMARWISGWGLVTIHVSNAPLGKVIASIASQGHVRVESALDPTQLISLDVDKVTPAEALNVLSIRTDASWRLVYLAAPTKASLNEAMGELSGHGSIDDWAIHYYPSSPFDADADQVCDPRFLELTMEGPDREIGKLLDEAAQKSGVMTASPQGWLPAIASLPRSNQVRKVLPALIGSAHGESAEFFLLSPHPQRQPWEQRGEESGSQDAPAPDPTHLNHVGSPESAGRFGGAASMNPAWRQAQQLARIKMLPVGQQEEAQKKLAERDALFDQLKTLSPEERRAKWQQMMADPANIQQMQDRMLLRQANQTAAQRINRSVNYLNRKASIQASQGH
jgi:hypothetical protein